MVLKIRGGHLLGTCAVLRVVRQKTGAALVPDNTHVFWFCYLYCAMQKAQTLCPVQHAG